ncbi:MAG: efflux RND transporter periplasmic adaptor subunit [FCB group bacterium]|jgi:multidrug efflux pump subunit AcrA (membrane-fusion protein)|nr:efflux RND transporter periplasmic adaptor subunit [FCB group bacterium]
MRIEMNGIYRATAAAALLITGLSACGREAEKPAETTGITKESALEAREVTVTKVTLRDFERTFRATGSLAPKEEAGMRGLVEGPLEAVQVDVGDRVKKGQELFHTRRTDGELHLQAAEAARRQAEAALAELKAWQRPEEVAAAEAQLAQARSQSERMSAERERARVLYERKSISESEWDATRTAAEAATEGVRAAEAQAQVARTGPTAEQIGVAEAAVNAAAAQVDQARQALADATVVAPFDGVITARRIKQGDFVNRGQEVVKVTALAVLEAEMNVPERFSNLVQTGLPVDVVVESTGVTRKGVVTAVNQSIDPQTRTFLVKIEVDNSDLQIKAGAFCVGVFNMPPVTGALAVPSEAILSEEGQYYVWVVRDGKSYRVNITPGATGERFTEIKEGVQDGDTVVVKGMGALADGSPVKVAEAAPVQPAQETTPTHPAA